MTEYNKVGIVSGAANYLPTWEARFAHLKALGYDTLDVGLSDITKDIYADTNKMETYCQEIREAADKNGLAISQVHGPWPTDDTTEDGVKRGWECMHKAVYGCHLLGAPYLVIHPQMPFGWGADNDPDFAEQQTVNLLKELAVDGERYGVTICLENMPFRKQRISSMQYIVQAVEKVNSSFVGICLDTGHCHYLKEDIADNVYLAKDHLKTLHIHDNRAFSDAHLLPFLGSLDWDAFAKALADIGFDGSLSLETGSVNPNKMDAPLTEAYEKFVFETVNKLRRMVAANRT